MKTLSMSMRTVFALLLLAITTVSHADMMISPVRILMDDSNKTTSMILRNTSSGSRTYRLSLEDKRAKENGGYDDINEGENWPSAKDMVRLSPRQITVGPGENQTIRFSWRPPSDIPTGEYRSHLKMQVVPEISEPSSTIGTEAGANGIGIKIAMQMSFSIPIVVRHDTDVPQVELENVQAVAVEDGKSMGLQITFNHNGMASSFGNVVVEMQRDDKSPVEIIGKHKELSIYPELDQRTIVVALRDKSIPAGAIVRVAYEGINEYDEILWTEKVFRTQ